MPINFDVYRITCGNLHKEIEEIPMPGSWHFWLGGGHGGVGADNTP